jgi:hypothetical protein
MKINDKEFIDSFLLFWNFHNDFNNNFIDYLINKGTELSLQDLVLLKQVFEFVSVVDFE